MTLSAPNTTERCRGWCNSENSFRGTTKSNKIWSCHHLSHNMSLSYFMSSNLCVDWIHYVQYEVLILLLTVQFYDKVRSISQWFSHLLGYPHYRLFKIWRMCKHYRDEVTSRGREAGLLVCASQIIANLNGHRNEVPNGPSLKSESKLQQVWQNHDNKLTS